MADAPNEDVNDTTKCTTTKPKAKKLATECKICGVPALYSYFGVVVCSSCKMFFSRNAPTKQGRFKCHYEGQCEININNRHICASCRLAKCFASGMQVEMLRAPRTARTTTRQQEAIMTQLTVSLIRKEKVHSQQLPTLNLLRSDHSTLSTDQWNLLSNLTHCYDEYSQFSLAQRFLQEQNQLPTLMRFKIATVDEFFTLIVGASEPLYEKNTDFVSLCSHDRTILLHNTMEYVTGLSTCFITRNARLFEDPALYRSVEILYGSDPVDNSNRAIAQLDYDNTFFKLIFALLTFSTYGNTYYTNLAPVNLENIKAVLHIQDMYTELVWRYLLYKYDHGRAVIYFVKLLRYLFMVQKAIIGVNGCEQYMNMIDSLIKRTEETLTVTE